MQEIRGNTKEVIEQLRQMMVAMWQREYETNPCFKICNSGKITPEDVANRWFNTSRHIYEDDMELIQQMTTRLNQSGYHVELG